MARRMKSKSVTTRELSSENGNLVRKDTKVTNTTSSHFNGQFVSSIFILICCLFIVVGVVGSVRHEPMDMLITCVQKVGKYGDGFKNDLSRFSDTMKTFTLEEDKTYTIFFNGNYTDFKLADWVVNVGNVVLTISKILLVVPVAIGLFSIRLIWLFIDIIGYCLIL